MSKQAKYTTSEALTGMMVFEHIEHFNRELGDKYHKYFKERGICEVRELCLVLGSYIDRVYDSCNMADVYSEPFDLEFVPAVLEELEDPFRAFPAQIQTAMLKVVQEKCDE